MNLAFVPSLFFGNEPARFYAANGWGSTALMGALLSYWLLAMGIATYRSAAGRTPAPAPPPPCSPDPHPRTTARGARLPRRAPRAVRGNRAPAHPCRVGR